MICRAMKSHTNEHTVRDTPGWYTNTKGRQAISERVGLQGLLEINLRVNILSECYTKGTIDQPELPTLQLDKKHLQKGRRIFRRDRELSRIPARTHNV